MQTPYSISSTLYYVSVSSVMKTSTPDVGKKHYFEVTQLWRVLERGPSTDRPFMYSAVLDQWPLIRKCLCLHQPFRQSWCSYCIRISLNFFNFHSIPIGIPADIHTSDVQKVFWWKCNNRRQKIKKNNNNNNNNHYRFNGRLSFGWNCGLKRTRMRCFFLLTIAYICFR